MRPECIRRDYITAAAGSPAPAYRKQHSVRVLGTASRFANSVWPTPEGPVSRKALARPHEAPRQRGGSIRAA